MIRAFASSLSREGSPDVRWTCAQPPSFGGCDPGSSGAAPTSSSAEVSCFRVVCCRRPVLTAHQAFSARFQAVFHFVCERGLGLQRRWKAVVDRQGLYRSPGICSEMLRIQEYWSCRFQDHSSCSSVYPVHLWKCVWLIMMMHILIKAGSQAIPPFKHHIEPMAHELEQQGETNKFTGLLVGALQVEFRDPLLHQGELRSVADLCPNTV